jgi:hypothetical protein
MKLLGTPVQPDQIDLYLTVNFNEQCEPLVGGSVKFGLKGGELKLRLENGSIPYEFRELTGSLKLSPHQQEQDSQDNQAQNTVESSVVQSQDNVSAKSGTELTQDKTNPHQLVAFQVATKGSQQNPVWVFEVETGESILKGSINNVKLATLKAIALPCYVEATFEVSLQDVYLTQTTGLWSPNISRNQLAVLERGIARLLLKRKLKPYLSQIKLRYD